jgi:hypothetical protein
MRCIYKNYTDLRQGTDKFYLSLFGPGRDARRLCRPEPFLQSISIPQVPSSREALFCRSLHNRPKLGITYLPIRVSVTGTTEELVTAIAATHNVVRAGGEEVIPT